MLWSWFFLKADGEEFAFAANKFKKKRASDDVAQVPANVKNSE